MPGIGRRTAEVVIAEIGVDMSRFPTSGHLASWAGLCPGHHESAGKQRSGKARKGNAALPSALCEAALSAAAFEVFTIGIGSWWDADKLILSRSTGPHGVPAVGRWSHHRSRHRRNHAYVDADPCL